MGFSKSTFGFLFCGFAVLSAIGNPIFAASIEENIRAIKSVGPEGKEHAAAIAAVKELSKASGDSILIVLDSFEGANPLASNWLRSTVDTIAERTLKESKSLPATALESFVRDTTRAPEARRLAYEWLARIDASAPDRLIPGMLNDACPEFRRDAVQRLIDEAKKARNANDKETETTLLRKAMTGAIDDDQVKSIVKPLRENGETINLPKHFGFLTHWYLMGPFDNVGLKGFDVAYPPEKGVDLKAKYEGKSGEVAWHEVNTDDEYGVLDIAKKTEPYKGAVTYAATTFVSDKAREIEVRLGTPNAWKLWVNGVPIFARDEYHRGTMLDQYKVTAKLTPGPNTILLKVCQNEQTEEWAQVWKFQLRICDRSGVAVPSVSTETSSSN